MLGLVKHVAIWDSRYLGEVFDRPFPEPIPRWDDPVHSGTDHWATENESVGSIVELYQRVWAHTDTTIDELDLSSLGYVPWWEEEVPLFNVMLHCLSETTRHVGHADILREGLDGEVGVEAGLSRSKDDDAFWAERRETIERAAQAASKVGPE